MGGWTWDLSPIKMGPLAPINVGVHAWKPVTNSDGTVYIRVNLGAMSDNNGGAFFLYMNASCCLLIIVVCGCFFF